MAVEMTAISPVDWKYAVPEPQQQPQYAEVDPYIEKSLEGIREVISPNGLFFNPISGEYVEIYENVSNLEVLPEQEEQEPGKLEFIYPIDIPHMNGEINVNGYSITASQLSGIIENTFQKFDVTCKSSVVENIFPEKPEAPHGVRVNCDTEDGLSTNIKSEIATVLKMTYFDWMTEAELGGFVESGIQIAGNPVVQQNVEVYEGVAAQREKEANDRKAVGNFAGLAIGVGGVTLLTYATLRALSKPHEDIPPSVYKSQRSSQPTYSGPSRLTLPDDGLPIEKGNESKKPSPEHHPVGHGVWLNTRTGRLEINQDLPLERRIKFLNQALENALQDGHDDVALAARDELNRSTK